MKKSRKFINFYQKVNTFESERTRYKPPNIFLWSLRKKVGKRSREVKGNSKVKSFARLLIGQMYNQATQRLRVKQFQHNLQRSKVVQGDTRSKKVLGIKKGQE